eukprot:EG_transcript_4133
MWSLGPRCHPLGRLYRFREAALEAQYRTKTGHWRRTNAVVHFYVRLGLAVIGMLRCVGEADGTVLLCAYAALGALSLGCAGCSHFWGAFGRHIDSVHALFCVVTAAVLSWLVTRQAEVWAGKTYRAWVPPDRHLFLVDADSTVLLDAAFQQFATETQSCLATSAVLGALAPVWLHLALGCLTPGAVAATVVVAVAVVCGVGLTPGLPPLDGAVACAGVGAAALACVVVNVLLERTRRAGFLAKALLVREMKAAQLADSILNHTLKNTLADVAGTLELVRAGLAEDTALEDSVACLRRGMRCCKARQVYLKLVAGEYEPAVNVVDLEDFGTQLVCGREVAGVFPRLTVQMDAALVSLILENAISNAFKHGAPENPKVRLTIERLPPDEMGRPRLRFAVHNAAHPLRPPLTEQSVAQLFAGRPASNCSRPALSDHVGLTHCLLAAQRGGLALSLTQADGDVTFAAVLAADVVADPSAKPDGAPAAVPSPCHAAADGDPVRVFILDDSRVARRLLEYYVRQHFNVDVVRCFGAQEADLAVFLAEAPDNADIVIIDQNLEFSTSRLGTDLVEQLHQSDFPGLICIRSANDGPEDRAGYARSGAHCSFGKDVPGAVLMAELGAAYQRHRLPAISRSISGLPGRSFSVEEDGVTYSSSSTTFFNLHPRHDSFMLESTRSSTGAAHRNRLAWQSTHVQASPSPSHGARTVFPEFSP